MLVTVIGNVRLWPNVHAFGTLLMLYVADHAGDATDTFADPHCWNQNSCSLIISASSTIEPFVRGAVTLTVTVTLAPGLTSAGSEKAWLVSQCDWLGAPPVEVAKWRSRSTSLNPVDGHVAPPMLLTVTLTFWLCPAAQLVGAWLMS